MDALVLGIAQRLHRPPLDAALSAAGWENQGPDPSRRTGAMFDRYNITDEDDLAAAVAKLNGRVTAKSEGAAEKMPELS